MNLFFQMNLKNNYQKLEKKDKAMFERLKKKIKSILLEPHHIKHLRNVLKGEQRTQLGSFVLRFEVKENRVYFITFRHHDFAY